MRSYSFSKAVTSCVCRERQVTKGDLPSLRLLLLLAVLLIAAACSGGSTPEDTTIRWRAQAGVPSNSWSYQDHFVKFAELVKDKSQGRLEIEIFPPGTVVDAYEQFGAVQKKVLEVGMGVGGYNIKQVPEAYIELGLFGVFSSLQEFVNFYIYYQDGAVYQILDAAYREKGCHLLKSLGPSPLVLVSKNPITSVAQMKGMKIRGSGAAPDLISNLGGVPVTLAPAEIYLALQTGTIDGLITPQYAIGTLNLWDTAAEEAMLYYIDTITQKMDEILEIAQKEYGVQIVNLPDEEYAKILRAAPPILDQAASRSPRSEQIIEIMKGYLKQKGSPMVSP